MSTIQTLVGEGAFTSRDEINDNFTALNEGKVDVATDSTLTAATKLQFRDTGLFINSGADGKLTISSDGTGADDITLAGTVTISDEVLLSAAKKVQFRDTGLYINSGADGKLTISSDGAGADDITLAGTVSVSDDVLLATDKKVQFRDSGLFINSGADGKLTISADGVAEDDTTFVGTVKFTDSVTFATAAAALLSPAGFTMSAIARTATADGTGTGTIASGPMLQFIAVTAGGDADCIIVLPAPVPGSIVILHIGATGYELRTSNPATIGINGGVSAAGESAIAADTTVLMICASATSWKGLQLGSDGTLAKVQVAAD